MSARVATDAQILQAIDQSWADHWTSPTVRELAAMVGLHSTATMAVRLEQLVRAGLLERHGVSAARVLYRRPRASDGLADTLRRIADGDIPPVKLGSDTNAFLDGHCYVDGKPHPVGYVRRQSAREYARAALASPSASKPGVWLSRAEAYALLEGHDGTSLRAAREKLRETLR